MMNSNEKAWYSTELDTRFANIFKHYLRSLNIYFEPSEAGRMVYFKCLMTEAECEIVNSFLELLREGVVNNERPTA